MSEGVRIAEIRAENFKRLHVAEMMPKATGVIQLTGANAQGKSSFIEAMISLFGGKKGKQEVPVRAGEESATIRGRLTNGKEIDLIVTRGFTAAGGMSFTVRDAAAYPQGTPDRKMKPLNSPEEILKAFVGALTFDPVEFARKSADEQYAELRKAAKLEVDIDALAAENDKDFKARTDLNRDAKAIRARAEGICPKNPPAAKIDIAALASKIEEAAKHNGEIDTRAARREMLEKQIASERAETLPRAVRAVADIEKQISDLQAAKQAAQSRVKALEESIMDREHKLVNAEPLPDKIDVSEVRDELTAAQLANQEYDRAQARKQLLAEAVAIEARAEALTKRMAARDKQAKDALKSAKLPTANLALSATGVLYQGIPFNQASESQQLVESVAVGMAQNTGLRALFVRAGSGLDSKAIALLEGMAELEGYQIWLERVDESGKIGVVFEDGEIVAVNKEAS